MECNHILKRPGSQHLAVMVTGVRRNARENLQDCRKTQIRVLPRQVDVEVWARNWPSLRRDPPLFNPGGDDRRCS
jgi:hypothetical protein